MRFRYFFIYHRSSLLLKWLYVKSEAMLLILKLNIVITYDHKIHIWDSALYPSARWWQPKRSMFGFTLAWRKIRTFFHSFEMSFFPFYGQLRSPTIRLYFYLQYLKSSSELCNLKEVEWSELLKKILLSYLKAQKLMVT